MLKIHNRLLQSKEVGEVSTTKPRTTRLAVIALAAAASLILASCSGTPADNGPGQSSDSATVAAAVKAAEARFIEAQKAITKFDAPGPDFSVKGLAGKTVWYVVLDYSIPFFHVVGDVMKGALAKAGVGMSVCDGKGNPSSISQCMLQAIGAGAGAIIADGPSPAIIGSQMAEAKAAGIPVIIGDNLDPDSPIPPGASAVVANSASKEGEWFGDAVLTLGKGKASILVVSTLDVAQGELLAKGPVDAVKSVCDTCTAEVVNVPIAKWATDLQATVQAKLVANPNISYVVVNFDSMTPFIRPALAGTDIKIITQNANVAQMKDLAEGKDVVVEIGSDMGWQGWAFADQALRLMAGEPPVTHWIPLRLFTQDNVKGLTIDEKTAGTQEWYGGPELETLMTEGFLKMWGLAG